MKSLKFIFALLLPLALTACGKFTEVDLGYPKRVEFSKDGGEKSYAQITIFTSPKSTIIRVENRAK